VLERQKDATDAAPLREAIESLQKSTHKMAEIMYRSAAGAAAGGGNGEGAEAGAQGAQAAKDVIDAEFEETK